MNCLTALERLDLCRPDEALVFDAQGNELAGAAFDEAARHVQGCLACQTAMRRREKFDERIGQLTRDVPVPAGLRERLLSRLEIEPSSPGPVSSATAAQCPVSQPVSQTAGLPVVRFRRRVIFAAAAAGVMAALGVGIWKLAMSRPAALSMGEIAGYALSDGLKADDLPAIGQFPGGLAVQIPKTISDLPYATPFRRLVDPQLDDREIAVYFFTLARRNGRKFAGRLVVVPAALVKDLPAAMSFSAAETRYSRGFCTRSWLEGQFVYLCCVQGGDGELLLLLPKTMQAA